jgi:hypothetical protein
MKKKSDIAIIFLEKDKFNIMYLHYDKTIVVLYPSGDYSVYDDRFFINSKNYVKKGISSWKLELY